MHRIFPSIDLFNVTGRMTFNEPCLQHIPRDFDLCAPDSTQSNSIENKIASSEESNEEEYVFFMDKMLEKNENFESSKSSISIRNSFVPKAKCVFLSADYCQLELRIITNLCKDELLITIFNDSKHDVFNLLASKWLNVPVSEIDEEKRQNVKKIIYGILYGISPKTLSLILNSTETDACNFIESFKTKFCGLKKFINEQIENCKLKGYVETIRKRRRYLPNISSTDLKTRAQVSAYLIHLF
jgi:DNA polymerase theta